MTATIIVDDRLCISGTIRYNSRSQGAKKIIPTLIRALKLYEPKLVNSSLMLTPPIIWENWFPGDEKGYPICLYCKEESLIRWGQNQIHRDFLWLNLHSFVHSGKEYIVFFQGA